VNVAGSNEAVIERTAPPAPRRAGTRFVPYTDAERLAVLAFNERMIGGRAPTDFVLPDQPNAPNRDSDAAINWTKYVAVDDQDAVRGGFLLMEQRGWLNGASVVAANFQSPVSEGILDSRYGIVGLHMIRFIQRQWPYTFAVGMGSVERPLPRLLTAAGWTIRDVPFFFRIVRPRRVLRELRPLHARAWSALGARIAAGSGAGWLAARILHARLGGRPSASITIERLGAWDDEVDRLWTRTRNDYAFSVARDRATLNALYPIADDRYSLYAFRHGHALVGWAACAETAMRDHMYFGNLRVATILDAWAEPDAASSILTLLTDRLRRSADLIVSNQSHRIWTAAFRRAGFASARSNYLLALSKPLTTAVGDAAGRLHVTRGDGDGRIHLL
jgi:hypothetical protein